MTAFQLRSHVRRSRTIQVDPELDRRVEEVATVWAVSYSEAMNRIVREHLEVRRQLGPLAPPSGKDGIAPVLLEQLKREVCGSLDSVQEEIAKVKSNLYLLQTMQDRLASKAIPGPRYTEWRQEVIDVMDKRKGNLP